MNILRAGQIASRVNISVQKFPGVIAAPLLIGTLAGCGGKLLQDGVQLACGTLPGKSNCFCCNLWSLLMAASLCKSISLMITHAFLVFVAYLALLHMLHINIIYIIICHHSVMYNDQPSYSTGSYESHDVLTCSS